MKDAPASDFVPLANTKDPVTVESTINRAEIQFTHVKQGDACAAYEQIRRDLMQFEAPSKDIAQTKAFIGELSSKLERSGLLPAVEIAAIRYKQEEKAFHPATNDKTQINKKNNLERQEKDQGIQLLERALSNKRLENMSNKDSLEQIIKAKSEYNAAHTDGSGKANPKDNDTKIEQAKEKITTLKQHIAKVPGSWDEATSLHDLGALENFVGSPDAGQHFRDAIDKMNRDLPGQPKPEIKNTLIGQALSDYANYLIEAKPTDNQTKKVDIVAQRTEADRIFDQLIKIAPMAKFNDIDTSDIYRRKGDNQIFLASTNNVKDSAAKQLYKENLRAADKSYETGLKSIASDHSNIAIASRALLTGNRGFVNASAADSPEDEHAKNAEVYYKEALSQWHTFKISDDKSNQPKIDYETNSRDQALAGLLSNYIKLLEVEKRERDIVPLQKELHDVLNRHQNIKLQP